jgi:PPOX class probable F420-dependent enzyme
MIDWTTKLGKRALERLENEQTIWLTAVDASGVPQPNPVWFLWQDGSLLMYSKPDAKRLKHIASHPQVSVNFRHGDDDEDIVVMTGEARVDPTAPPSIEVKEYIEKYREGIKGIKMTPESLSVEYSVGFRFFPKTLRGF